MLRPTATAARLGPRRTTTHRTARRTQSDPASWSGLRREPPPPAPDGATCCPCRHGRPRACPRARCCRGTSPPRRRGARPRRTGSRRCPSPPPASRPCACRHRDGVQPLDRVRDGRRSTMDRWRSASQPVPAPARRSRRAAYAWPDPPARRCRWPPPGVAPASSAPRRRPTLLATAASLMLAHSSVFCSRLTTAARSSTRAVWYRPLTAQRGRRKAWSRAPTRSGHRLPPAPARRHVP
jgi:hypothetical protein